jgi:hypothetical protein
MSSGKQQQQAATLRQAAVEQVSESGFTGALEVLTGSWQLAVYMHDFNQSAEAAGLPHTC